eukprot:COSAG01_NODE_2803_length_7047_cov_19.196891_11_plen_218_part_00
MCLLFLSRNIEERNGPGQPMVIGSGLLLNQTIEKHFVENIDGCVMKYAMFVSTIDSPAPMIKKQAKTPSSGAYAHDWGFPIQRLIWPRKIEGAAPRVSLARTVASPRTGCSPVHVPALARWCRRCRQVQGDDRARKVQVRTSRCTQSASSASSDARWSDGLSGAVDEPWPCAPAAEIGFDAVVANLMLGSVAEDGWLTGVVARQQPRWARDIIDSQF